MTIKIRVINEGPNKIRVLVRALTGVLKTIVLEPQHITHDAEMLCVYGDTIVEIAEWCNGMMDESDEKSSE